MAQILTLLDQPGVIAPAPGGSLRIDPSVLEVLGSLATVEHAHALLGDEAFLDRALATLASAGGGQLPPPPPPIDGPVAPPPPPPPTTPAVEGQAAPEAPEAADPPVTRLVSSGGGLGAGFGRPFDVPNGEPQAGAAPGGAGSPVPPPLAAFAQVVEPDPSAVGRPAIVEHLMEMLLMRDRVTPCLVGPLGSGRTTLLGELAAALQADDDERLERVLRVPAEAILDRDWMATLDTLFNHRPANSVVVLDDADEVLGLTSIRGIRDALAGEIVANLRESKGGPIVLVIQPLSLERLKVQFPSLIERMGVVEVPAMEGEELAEVGAVAAHSLGEFHKVEVDADLVTAAAVAGNDKAQPGLLVERIDRACVRARRRSSAKAEVIDLPATGLIEVPEVEPDEIRAKLRERVVGQDHAIEQIVDRLAITRRGLDLRPDRPDGVFLFAGPTGVGKTELARALAATAYGSEAALIRLDMSEYYDDWAISRLIGSNPGYIGSDQPENWLTTRVRNTPECVVLLDEIEKAHPSVWRVFLQVFDAGRLTDGRGIDTTFSRATIVMTTNLGAKEATSKPVGFGHHTEDVAAADARLREVIEDILPPELIGRIDAIIPFRSLSESHVADIATREIARVTERLAARGVRVSVAPEVIELLAATRDHPELGARDLQRAIEAELLQPLALVPGQDLAVTVADGQIVITANG
ncbi:MAG: AAA family ATPase [Acidimicrobiales bacterium]